MFLIPILFHVGLIIPSLVSSETVNVDPKDFAIFVQKNEASFKRLYKKLRKGMQEATGPGILKNIFPLERDIDDNRITEELKELYMDVRHVKGVVDESLAGPPNSKGSHDVGATQQSANTLEQTLAWADSLNTRQIRVPDRVWQGYSDGIVDMPVFDVIAGLYQELGIGIPFSRYDNPLVLAKWLYAFRPFDEPEGDDEGEIGGDKEVTTATIDIDAPRFKTLTIADLATTIKEMAFRGRELTMEIRDPGFDGPVPKTIYSDWKSPIVWVQRYLDDWVEILKGIKEVLEDVHLLEIE
ncbi:hypothetical protein TWF102_003899 [Orbilia oligospora]|uniref:Uncharacterized protein n=1 Tax=Orbilia oligospora TaxID=2813651 RepID=A0A7C8J8Z8_ORBOL|nr:hypothetical protein TWF102_003899 [Orbilia oligospora]KAF3118279.1 hypothetical protein TWF103_000293 [Orbilia oligospora]